MRRGELSDVPELRDRVALYRANAQSARKSATGFLSPRVRRAFLDLASSWDSMAEEVEHLIQHRKTDREPDGLRRKLGAGE